MIEKYWSPVYKFFKTNVLYIIALLALVFLFTAYSCFEKEDIPFDIFKNLGFTLISGGVFAVIVKSEQFSKIFHNELRNIIYGDEDLKNRQDLEILWDKVTKALCNQKFKLISKKLHDGVKMFYLPINHEYYYKNHNVEIEIEIDKTNSDYLIVTEETKTTLISDDTKPICFKFSSKIPMVVGEEDLTDYELLSFTVNKEKIDLSKNELIVGKKDDSLSIHCDYIVRGKTQYNIVRKEKKRYNLKVNSYRHHNAIWLYENFFLDLSYPKELDIKFIEMGVVNKWDLERKDNHAFSRLKATYTGLIFKKQGFILLLNKI
jgi:hypothetical protein